MWSILKEQAPTSVLKRYDKAIADYDNSCSWMQRTKTAYIRRGDVYVILKDYHELSLIKQINQP